MKFNPDCVLCPRLSSHLKQVRKNFPDYHAKPVAPFGPKQAKLLIVGLAPGMHGANATGRPFTGDHAGILLYETLHKFGFSNKPKSVGLKDGLKLINCRITNAVKCLPPENKPLTSEVRICNAFLKTELEQLKSPLVILALGKIAHDAVLRANDYKLSTFRFQHGQVHELKDNVFLLDSYHCSRYNTQTRRLTTAMFEDIFSAAKKLLEKNH